MIKINVINKDDIVAFSDVKIGEYFTIPNTNTYLYLKDDDRGTCICFYDGFILPGVKVVPFSMKVIRLSKAEVKITIDVIK